MLVLARKPGETIMIGDLVEVEIVEIRRGKVKVGITAPIEVPVHRREVYDLIQREKESEEPE